MNLEYSVTLCGGPRDKEKKGRLQQINFRCTYWIWRHREKSEIPTKKGEWKPEFHKNKNSERPQCQQENVVPMSLKVFLPVPEGFSKAVVGGNVKKNGVPVWSGVEPISPQQLAQFSVWVQCENDADNTLLSCVCPKSRTFLCLVFCQ